MREILFRGEKVDDSEWVVGNLMASDDALEGYEAIIIPKVNSDIYTTSESKTELGVCKWYLVDPKTVCQYTGLKDKHGKKIFEADIIRYQYDNDDCPFPNKDTKKRIGRVFFQSFRASFAVAEGRNGKDYINQDLFRYVQNGNRVEVIGNIYDNPELLKEGD